MSVYYYGGPEQTAGLYYGSSGDERVDKMKRIVIVICAIFALTIVGCHDAEDANEKIDECLEEEYGENVSKEETSKWELTCEDGEEKCDDCVDCIMDTKCDKLLDGDCRDDCK